MVKCVSVLSLSELWLVCVLCVGCKVKGARFMVAVCELLYLPAPCGGSVGGRTWKRQGGGRAEEAGKGNGGEVDDTLITIQLNEY